MLKVNTTLTTLNLRCEERKGKKRKKEKEEIMTGNEIGVEGAKAMSEVLKVNTTLTSLNLGGDEERERDRNER